MNIELVVNGIYEPYLYDNHPLEIFYGGAASGKSHFIAQKILFLGLTEPGHNFLVIRKVADTIRNSVFALFEQAINLMKITDFIKLNKSAFSIDFFKNKNQIICKGLDDPEKIKSITFKNGPLTDIWIEEATELTEKDFDQLQLRKRGLAPVRKQTILTFNPITELHWIKKRHFDVPDPDYTTVIKTTYRDNRFLTKEDIELIEKYRTIDPSTYQVYGLGEWGRSEGLIFNNWEVQDFDYTEDQMPIFCGQDWGVNDPAVCVKVGMKDKNIYIFDEYYKRGITDNQQVIEDIRTMVKSYYVVCDNSETKSIADFQRSGIRAMPCSKGKDSVIHGIKWLRGRKIFIKSHCINTIKEFQSYKWKQTKDGQYLDMPIDMFNHCVDSIRYACMSWMEESKGIQMSVGKLF
jgi:phage terminase large subunit